MRFTNRMSSRAQWIVAWAGISAAALAVVFFVATQTITLRDILVTVIGALLGATIAAFISTWVFHGDGRKNTQRAEREAASLTAAAEVERLNALTADEGRAAKTTADAKAEAIRITAEAEADAIRTRANADAALAAKRADLLTALPTRRERLTELHQEITLTHQNINTAKANADASSFQARDALSHGFRDITHEREADAKNWRLNADEFARRLPDLEAERDQIQAMSDEEFLSFQTRTRGIA